MMDKINVLILSSILRRLGSYNMKSFKNRLLLQKTVYFLQVFKLDFGYRFNWYVYGPYSTDLTKDGYEMENLEKAEKIEFINPEFENCFGKLKKFLGNKKGDVDWLELLASVHFLKITSLARTKEEIIDIITNKQTHFTDEDCEKAFGYLKRYGL